jgi:hypothetical protein
VVPFGVSNMIRDIFECARELDMKITAIVLNVPEQKHPLTKNVATGERATGRCHG